MPLFRHKGTNSPCVGLVMSGLLLTAGCGGTAHRAPVAGTPSPHPDTAKPTVTVQFAESRGFRYRYAMTGATFNPTGDPAASADPATPGTNYLVVRGTLTNLLTDRPAPRYSSGHVGQHLGVTAPKQDVRRAIPGDSSTPDRCTALTVQLSGVYGNDVADQPDLCLFNLDPSVVDGEDDATIPAGGSAEVTYTALVPDKLPKDRMRIVVVTNTGKATSPGTTVSQSVNPPWQ